jgi:transmembrane sensor
MSQGHPDPRRTEHSELDHLRSIVLALPPPSLPTRAELLADAAAIEIDRPDLLAQWMETTQSPRTARARRGKVPFYVKVTTTTLVLIWAILIAQRIPLPSQLSLATSLEYATQADGPREITLPDHSEVTLSNSTEMEVLFSEHRRHVVLKKGEALFKVQHDPQAPFQVDAGTRRITDLGTAFDVRRYSDSEVVVSVTEGSVAVTPLTHDMTDSVSASDQRATTGDGSGTQPARIEINAGEQLSYTATGEITRPHPVDLEALTSWLYGHRVYRGKALAKVIQDVQLYTPRLIELDPALAAVRYSGYLDQREAEQWVRGLPTIYPVEIDDSNPRLLRVRCRLQGCPDVGP